MRNVTLLIKPASSLCNMRCRYCFYRDESAYRTEAATEIMRYETVDRLIDQALDAADWNGNISFAFQGGEPTMAGLAFFRYFTEQVHQRNTRHIPVQYAIQTNGLNLDRDWAGFLAEKHFLVGVSLDGDKALHDEFRLDAAGKGTWTRVRKKLDLLMRSGVECNLLCVVTRRCAKSAVHTYHALKKTGVRYLQFIPCLDPLGEPRGMQPWSLTPKDYGDFLCALFDEWYRDWELGHYISVRLFEDYVHLVMGLPANTCATSGGCGSYFVVEADGGVYPCDFYVLDEWKLGNLQETALPVLAGHPLAQKFLQEGEMQPDWCADCRWKSLCNGGCKRDWIIDPDGQRKNYYCQAFQKFFEHAVGRLGRIAASEAAIRDVSLF